VCVALCKPSHVLFSRTRAREHTHTHTLTSHTHTNITHTHTHTHTHAHRHNETHQDGGTRVGRQSEAAPRSISPTLRIYIYKKNSLNPTQLRIFCVWNFKSQDHLNVPGFTLCSDRVCDVCVCVCVYSDGVCDTSLLPSAAIFML
jgi:hypothetical protein